MSSYQELVRTGLIPDLASVTPSVSRKRIPQWVTKNGLLELYTKFLERLHSGNETPALVWAQFSQLPLQGDYSWRPQTEGWPTVVHVVGNFEKTATQAYLKLLAAVAQCAPQWAGIILPLQQQVLWYQLADWDPSTYRLWLNQEAVWSKEDDERLTMNIFSLMLGNHVPRGQLSQMIDRPAQVFLGSPKDLGKLNLTGFSIPTGARVWAHAPYIIRLADDDPRGIHRLKEELVTGANLGLRGVIVHLGYQHERPLAVALQKMEQNVWEALTVTSPNCPLLIETGAGEGTRLCTNISELLAFYERFGNDRRLGICIDSCHVFAAGYDPSWFLEQWLVHHPDSVKLIHFNDSETPRGSRVDRHHQPGLGYIGYQRMERFYRLCLAKNLPMVIE